ncbi:hypothetical protein [Nonomuraea turcica]|uniref:hypothetical protein n=1 Tax=Nonomuraea sp. G32 TaxID=3067274 RepID=UPI00273C676A|nr:hypothetical protein [Nonomuraea sp. G32]MDP4511287.1 hypothetical protein [Nonomuraea sp. G32]
MRSHAGQTPMYPGLPRPLPANNNFAVASLIQGVLGLLNAFVIPGLGFVLGVMACVFGGLGMSRANKVGKGQGMAITGIVLGPIAITVSILAGIVWAGINS